MENQLNQQPEYNPQFMDLDPIKTTQFEADGITYYIDRTNKLSYERNKRLEQFKLYTLYGRDPDSILLENKKVIDFINQGKPAEAAITVNNVMNAINDLANKEAPIMWLCTLFINEASASEDVGAWTQQLGQQKINHWKNAYPIIPSDFFLALGFVYLKISREIWNDIIQTYSGLLPDNPILPED